MMRHAIVTGASSGIGEAIVTQLLEDGWCVTGLSRRAVIRPCPRFTHIDVDLSDIEMLSNKLAQLTVPAAIIHAAGMMAAAPLGKLDSTVSRDLWQIHVLAPEIIVNHFAAKMKKDGRIIIIGSRTSTGAANRSQYVATKSALRGMVRSWAAELAPRGITANIVAPGATATPMLKAPGRDSSPPIIPPIGRLIEPQEVAGLVQYLLSPGASDITGQEIIICGGGSL